MKYQLVGLASASPWSPDELMDAMAHVPGFDLQDRLRLRTALTEALNLAAQAAIVSSCPSNPEMDKRGLLMLLTLSQGELASTDHSFAVASCPKSSTSSKAPNAWRRAWRPCATSTIILPIRKNRT